MNSQVLRRFEVFLATPELPSLGPKPRATRIDLSTLNDNLKKAFSENGLPEANEALIRSLVLLWHDHLDESHSLSQDIHSADGSFLHGIMHRREPDYFNAKYWFNRVGSHFAFPLIAERVAQLLQEQGEDTLERQLVRGGSWNPNAFVEACQSANESGAATVETLKQVQEIEFRVLLEQFCEGSR